MKKINTFLKNTILHPIVKMVLNEFKNDSNISVKEETIKLTPTPEMKIIVPLMDYIYSKIFILVEIDVKIKMKVVDKSNTMKALTTNMKLTGAYMSGLKDLTYSIDKIDTFIRDALHDLYSKPWVLYKVSLDKMDYDGSNTATLLNGLIFLPEIEAAKKTILKNIKDIAKDDSTGYISINGNFDSDIIDLMSTGRISELDDSDEHDEHDSEHDYDKFTYEIFTVGYMDPKKYNGYNTGYDIF